MQSSQYEYTDDLKYVDNQGHFIILWGNKLESKFLSSLVLVLLLIYVDMNEKKIFQQNTVDSGAYIAFPSCSWLHCFICYCAVNILHTHYKFGIVLATLLQ